MIKYNRSFHAIYYQLFMILFFNGFYYGRNRLKSPFTITSIIKLAHLSLSLSLLLFVSNL